MLGSSNSSVHYDAYNTLTRTAEARRSRLDGSCTHDTACLASSCPRTAQHQPLPVPFSQATIWLSHMPSSPFSPLVQSAGSPHRVPASPRADHHAHMRAHMLATRALPLAADAAPHTAVHAASELDRGPQPAQPALPSAWHSAAQHAVAAPCHPPSSHARDPTRSAARTRRVDTVRAALAHLTRASTFTPLGTPPARPFEQHGLRVGNASKQGTT